MVKITLEPIGIIHSPFKSSNYAPIQPHFAKDICGTIELKSDTGFASNPQERLFFFYRRSPHWDEKINLYPVGKIMEPIDLPM